MLSCSCCGSAMVRRRLGVQWYLAGSCLGSIWDGNVADKKDEANGISTTFPKLSDRNLIRLELVGRDRRCNMDSSRVNLNYWYSLIESNIYGKNSRASR